MSGLGDAHTHFTWNGGDLARLGDLDIEEHVLLTVKSAQCFLDSGYTMYANLVPVFCAVNTNNHCSPGASGRRQPRTALTSWSGML